MKRNWEVQEFLKTVVELHDVREYGMKEGRLKSISCCCLAIMRSNRLIWGYKHGLYTSEQITAMNTTKESDKQ